MEHLVNTSQLVQDKAVKRLIKKLKGEEIKKMIDAGSGKISASILLKYFPNAQLDAIIYPGDNRKKNPLQSTIGSDRIDVIELDFCSSCIRKKYDLCLAMLTLGEALHFGNYFEALFYGIMEVRAKYFILFDILEDPSINYRYVEEFLKERNFKILAKKKFRNPHPEHYPKVKFDKYKLEFDSKHYVAYLIKNSSLPSTNWNLTASTTLPT